MEFFMAPPGKYSDYIEYIAPWFLVAGDTKFTSIA
jgi:hypothetical protein